MIKEVSKTKELSNKVSSTPIIMTPEQIDEDFEFAQRLHEDYLTKSAGSSINSKDWYPTC